ncbi:MAG: hypothetical protein ACFE8U_07445 [Candidatus Hermodarchaeota archaeon]
MSIRPIIQKFAEGFMVTGIFLQTPQELFPIFQQKMDTLLILKRHPDLQTGINELEFEDNRIGVLVDPIKNNTKLIIMADAKHIHEVAAHWKRFSPVVKEKFQVEEFIQQESIEMRLVSRLEEIRIAIEDATSYFKGEKEP